MTRDARFGLVLFAACNSQPPISAAPAPAPDPPPSHSPSASASPPPPAVLATPRSYAALCPELASALAADADADADAGAARPPTATDLMVSAKMKTTKKEFIASIAVPAKRIDREVFRMSTEGDPLQCCSRATADALDVTCHFGGIDIIELHARASVEGDAVVIRWCKANLSTGERMDRGEERVPRGGSHAWFGASTPACAPKLPQ
jgi:hypothetical protein